MNRIVWLLVAATLAWWILWIVRLIVGPVTRGTWLVGGCTLVASAGVYLLFKNTRSSA